MPITKERTKEIIKELGKNDSDSGNTGVQIALLSEKIKALTEHLKTHSKDHHTRYGLMKLVGQRKSLLNYLMNEDIEQYRQLIKKLGIRK